MNGDIQYKYSNDGLARFEDNYFGDEKDIHQRYLGFSQFIQGLFIGEGGYIVDTGNFETVNLELMHRVREKVKKHPLLWKSFFMIG